MIVKRINFGYWISLVGVSQILAFFPSAIPVKARPFEFLGSISVSERYDDNIFFEEVEVETDLISSVSPKFTTLYKTKTIDLSSELGGRAEFFAGHPESNNVQYQASMSLKIPHLGRNTSFSMVDVFQFSQELPDFLVGEEEVPEEVEVSEEVETSEEVTTGGISVSRGDSLSNFLRVDLTRQVSPRTDGWVGYTNSTRLYEDPTLIDSTIHGVRVGVARQVTSHDKVDTSYGYSLSLPSQDEEETESHTVHVGLNHRFSPTFSANVGMGVTYVVQDLENDLVGTGSVRILKRLKRFRVSLGYTKGINTSSGLVSDPLDSQVVSARISASLTRSLSGFLSQDYSSNKSTLDEGVDLQSWQTRVRLRMRIQSWLNGNIEYSYFSQVSGGIGEEFDRNQVLVSLNADLL